MIPRGFRPNRGNEVVPQDNNHSISVWQAGDEDAQQHIMHFVLTVAEDHIRELAKPDSPQQICEFQSLLQFVLEMTQHPGEFPTEETLSRQCGRFWYLLTDTLSSVDEQVYPLYLSHYGCYYPHVLKALHTKLQYPRKVEIMDELETEMFQTMRTDAAETLSYLSILMKADYFHHGTQLLQETLSSNVWQSTEAALFVIKGGAESVTATGQWPIIPLLSLYSGLPAHPEVIRTAILVLSEFSEWFNGHPETLGHVCPYLLQV